ncbi:hypothetical protein P3875_09560 [Myroides sp. JBRI-B21084]|uniref:hypothetical protein n=1 Tax=Myroides sp. JBRI-B21084 TaxID=3119977 RepID=UPI0026E1638D|nr:hypothetical protein [Paenimyroides cloacae]WKW46022.1 hypothetical protein P3875_09560 [Paenimyroides cloacae]
MIVLVNSCNRTNDDKFPIISKFKESKDQYSRDTINLEELSSEGGELIVYYKKSDTLVLDFFLYGETGKLNYTYFTNSKFEYKFVIKRDYTYHGLITDIDIKIDSTIYYIENETIPKIYNKNAVEIKDLKKVDSIKSVADDFFKNTAKYIKVIK